MKSELYNDRCRQGLRIGCGLAVIAILTATLWPFDLFPPNRVSWLPKTNGIRFDRFGVVVSNGSLSGGVSDFYTLEMLVRSANVDNVQTILSFYTPNNPKHLLIRQWKSDLLISHGFVNGIGVDHFFQPGPLVFFAVTSGPSRTVVYKNGRLVRSFPKCRIAQADLSGEIVIGTSAVDFEPWLGEVRELAIYPTELMPTDVARDYSSWIDGNVPADSDAALVRYTFAERSGDSIQNTEGPGPSLKIPRIFRVPKKGFLKSPQRDFEASWHYVLHVFENIAAFFPLGLLVCAYYATTTSTWRAILLTIVTVALLSLAIELLQAYIPQRESDLTDVISNTVGGFCGALMARSGIIQALLHTARRSEGM